MTFYEAFTDELEKISGPRLDTAVYRASAAPGIMGRALVRTAKAPWQAAKWGAKKVGLGTRSIKEAVSAAGEAVSAAQRRGAEASGVGQRRAARAESNLLGKSTPAPKFKPPASVPSFAAAPETLGRAKALWGKQKELDQSKADYAKRKAALGL